MLEFEARKEKKRLLFGKIYSHCTLYLYIIQP